MDKDQNNDTTNVAETGAPVAEKTAPVLPGGQVMDIQAPKSSTNSWSNDNDAQSPSQDTPAPESTIAEGPQVTAIHTGEDAEPSSESVETSLNSASESSSNEVVSPPEDTPSDNSTQAVSNPGDENVAAAALALPTDKSAESAGNPLGNPLAATQPKKSGVPMVAILVAVVVALALSGLVVAVYMKTKNSSKQAADKSKTSNSQGIAPKPQATAADVDTTTQEIDTTLSKVDDTKDFSSTDLSDSALGL